jgi:hypothetical protein
MLIIADGIRAQSLTGSVRSCPVPGNGGNRKINPLNGFYIGQSHIGFNPGKLGLLLGCYGFVFGHHRDPFI